MKIALLISGHCRTFVYEEQRIFFEKLIKYLQTFGHCDTFIMLKTDQKMQTYQGIKQLEKMIKMLNPVYSIAFKQWNQHDNNCYYSQMKMIRHLVDKSANNYDYYIRIRPDCVILHLEQIQLNISTSIISSRKFDSRGNDQFFIMSQKIVKEWFLKLPIIPMKVSPEYYIFNVKNIKIKTNIHSGLVRDYKRIESWNTHHSHLNIKNYWIKQVDYTPISYDIFINKLKNIINYQEVI
jgi:hypothetical protein